MSKQAIQEENIPMMMVKCDDYPTEKTFSVGENTCWYCNDTQEIECQQLKAGVDIYYVNCSHCKYGYKFANTPMSLISMLFREASVNKLHLPNVLGFYDLWSYYSSICGEMKYYINNFGKKKFFNSNKRDYNISALKGDLCMRGMSVGIPMAATDSLIKIAINENILLFIENTRLE